MVDIHNSKNAKISEIDKLCNEYFFESLKLEPENAVMFHLENRINKPNNYSDYSPKGRDKTLKICQKYLDKAKKQNSGNFREEIVRQQFIEALSLVLETEEKFLDSYRFMNNLFSPFQSLRMIFDLMSKESAQDFAAIFARLDNIPKAVRGYIKSLQKGIEIGVVNTVRQCQLVIEQIDNQIDQKISFFATLPKLARDKNIDNRLVKNIEKALDKVYKSFIKLKEFLQENYIPAAQKDDAVGQERYKYYAKHYVGQDINIENSYKYGIEEIDRIMQEQFSLAKGFGAQSDNGVEAVKEAARILNSRPEQAIAGADNLKKYMQSTADKAMQYLVKNNHFDIPKLVQTVQAMIVPTGDGVVYYTPPTADFSVPGRMWWSIPEGVETQYKWNSKSTIFHEGVPGHHLQVGLQVYLKDKLNDWQRMALLISGYAEGWALYAEQLMDEFGMLSLEEKFGMLDMQKLRAARIVIDIGVHCKMEVPAHWQKRYGEGIWDYDKAKIFLADMVNMNEGFRKFELDRYMGLPGQAIAYKLGQKNWLELRQKAMTKGWTLKEFHDKALSWGCLSFNLLDKALFG